MPAQTAAIIERLRAIPDLPAWAPETLSILPLPSLTNRSFKLTLGGESFVLRLPRAESAGHVDRAAEGQNTAIAAMLGFAPKLVFFDPADGAMLTRFVAGSTALTAETLRRPERLTAAVALLSRLHASGCSFRGEMELSATLDRYIALAGADSPAAEGIDAVRRAAQPVEAALAARPEPLVPCHIDPSPGNFLAAMDRLYLVDWEYAAMCEPLWDLADLSVEAAFDADQDAAALERYLGGAPPRLRARFALLKPMLDLLAAAWAAVQVAADNDSTDFAAYARARLQRAEAALADPALGTHLEAVR